MATVKKPIRVFWSELGQRFYASDSYTIRNKTFTLHRKTDVTNDIAHAMIEHEITFTPEEIRNGRT